MTSGQTAGPIDIVVLLTSFNRPETTKSAVQNVLAQCRRLAVRAEIVVIDASTTEDTEISLRGVDGVRFRRVPPSVHWAQGMRIAWLEAQQLSWRYLIWLNDDVVLDGNVIERSIGIDRDLASSCVLVGATRSAAGEISYAGYRRVDAFRRLSFRKVFPTEQLEACDAMNGNYVFIPARVDALVGGFPAGYVHGFADLAYGLRAKAKGVRVLLIPATVGVCEVNPIEGTWVDPALGLRQSLHAMIAPKALPPRAWIRFCLTHGGLMGPLYCAKPWVSLVKLHLRKRLSVRQIAKALARD